MRARHVFALAGLALAFTLHPTPTHAQDRPVVFLHGLNADASSWAAAADRLRGRVALIPDVPTVQWRRTYEDQADELQAKPEAESLPESTVAIGHSNGGLVAREWSKRHPINGLITIGAPHRGAPLLEHIVAWNTLSAQAPFWLNRVLDAFSVVSDWSFIFDYFKGAMNWFADFSIWSVVNLSISLGIVDRAPVLYEMLPASPYLLGLNSDANLHREASQVPNRVGIVSVAHNFYWAGPARAIAPDIADPIAAAMYGAAFGFLYWSNYISVLTDPSDVVGMDQSLSLLGLAGYILSIDPFYCRAVSDINMTVCRTNDGVVPTESQAYPGAPNLIIGTDDDGPAHTQETSGADDALYDALVYYTHVPRRGEIAPPSDPPPPPPPDEPVDPHTSSSWRVTLEPDERLFPDERLTSPNGRYHLLYQQDGNLVLYRDDGTPLWGSGTEGTPAGFVLMQADGNLVIYGPDSVPFWGSGSSFGHSSAHLVVQDDGNVVIYDVDGTPLWATGTDGR